MIRASPASPIDYLKLPIQTLKVGSLGTHKALGLANAPYLVAAAHLVYAHGAKLDPGLAKDGRQGSRDRLDSWIVSRRAPDVEEERHRLTLTRDRDAQLLAVEQTLHEGGCTVLERPELEHLGGLPQRPGDADEPGAFGF